MSESHGAEGLESSTDFGGSASLVDEVSTRRSLVASLLGGLGAATLLGCSANANEESPELVGEIAEALGTTGVLKVADTAANLRAVAGGTTTWVAVLQGISSAQDGGGGIFFWSSSSKPDDGWSVLNAGAGTSAGWRRVNLGISIVASVANLRLLPGGSARSVALLTGHTTAGDGGGGLFYWSTVAAPDNGGTILNLGSGASAGWRRLFSGPVNVRWFGAPANGLSDAAPAFRNAIAAASSISPVVPVFVPAGTYLMDSAVSAPGVSTSPANFILTDGARLYGDGSQSVLLWKAKQSLPADPMSNDLILLNGSNITISDLTIRGTNGTSDGSGYVQNDAAMQYSAIYARFIFTQPNYIDNIEIARCRFENLFGFMAHSVDNDTRFRFVDNVARYCGNGCNICAHRSVFSGNTFLSSEGIETSGSFNRIENNYFEGATATVSITGFPSGAFTTNVIVSGNTFDLSAASPGGSSIGIIGTDCYELTIANNTILNAPSIGIYLLGSTRRCQRIVVTGNVVSYDANWNSFGVPAAIQLYNVDDASVTSNAVKGGFWGIELLNARGVTIQGNTVSFAGQSGIAALSGSADISVTSNDVHSADAAGLDLYGVVGATIMGNRFKDNNQADVRTDSSCASLRSVANRYDSTAIANPGSFVYSAGDGS